MIENVGNLVCPALFDLGEPAKVVIMSVTEGEDKPLTYPYMFRASHVMVLNKHQEKGRRTAAGSLRIRLTTHADTCLSAPDRQYR